MGPVIKSGRSRNPSPSPVGILLQHWRKVRRMSQLDLAAEAGASSRHVCFVETGRAKPSPEMVIVLANALGVPLREQNSFLLAAGYAPVYRETPLDAPELGPARSALDAILRQQEPYPAVVMTRHWDILRTNDAASRFFGFLLGADKASGPANVVRMMFDPKALKPYVADWERVAETLIRRIHRESVGGVTDEKSRKLIEEVLKFPEVPERWRHPDLEAPQDPVIPVSFRKNGRTFDFMSTVTTLGTPQDITLQEIRIECFFPMNLETERQARLLI